MCIGCVTGEARTCIVNKSCDITIVFIDNIALELCLQSTRIITNDNFGIIVINNAITFQSQLLGSL